jgi:GT2 family glycosyltransferase
MGDLYAKIGLGIVTYNRPDYFKKAIKSVRKNLGDILDELIVYHDGPLPKGYPKNTPHGKDNRGVAYAKNQLLKKLLDRGCEYIFVMEDDVEVLDRMAVIGYLAAHSITGIPHFNFYGHGDNLWMEPLAVMEGAPVVFWPNAVGAYSFYTREALEQVGLMDENFVNAYEHIEHSWRIYRDHYEYGFWPDVLGSSEWLMAQPDALKNSSIRDLNGDWTARVRKGLEYWRSIDPDCPASEPNWDVYSRGESIV